MAASAASSAGPWPAVRTSASELSRVTDTRFRSTAPPSVPSGSDTASPHFIATRKVPGWPTLGSRRGLGDHPGRYPADGRVRQPAMSSTVRFGTLTLTTTGPTEAGWTARPPPRVGHSRGALPHLAGQHLVPALAFDPESLDRLAHGHAADATGPSREGGADRAGVVHRTTHVDARVDARHHQVEREDRRHPDGRT